MVAGNIFALVLVWHEIIQKAISAGIRAFRIAEVDAADRILKDGGRLPRRAHRAPVAALFQEVQLELQYFENISLVIGHGTPPLLHLFPSAWLQARTAIPRTIFGDDEPGCCDVPHMVL